jgi:hypothetical protein
VILRYAGAVLLVLLAGAALIASASRHLGEAGVRGALLGAGIAAVVAVGGMALVAWSFERGPQKFFGALVGGILGRLAFFGAVLVYVALRAAGSYDLVSVALSLLGFYVIFQWLELWFVIKGLKGRRR